MFGKSRLAAAAAAAVFWQRGCGKFFAWFAGRTAPQFTPCDHSCWNVTNKKFNMPCGFRTNRTCDRTHNRLFRRRSKKTSKLHFTCPLWGEFTGHQWIPLIKGQYRGKYFHLMTSSWCWEITISISIKRTASTATRTPKITVNKCKTLKWITRFITESEIVSWSIENESYIYNSMKSYTCLYIVHNRYGKGIFTKRKWGHARPTELLGSW